MTRELREREWALIKAKKQVEWDYTKDYVDLDEIETESELRDAIRDVIRLLPPEEIAAMDEEVQREYNRINAEFDKLEGDDDEV